MSSDQSDDERWLKQEIGAGRDAFAAARDLTIINIKIGADHPVTPGALESGVLAEEEIEDGIGPDAVESTPESAPPGFLQRPSLPVYVHRPKLEARFQALRVSGAKVIVLHGLPGMGKTWLAEQLTRDRVTGDFAPFIDASRPESFSRDIMTSFWANGAEVLPKAPDPATQLASLACSEQAPPFVVLDNLDSANELNELIPRHTRSVIVATCRRAADPPVAYEVIHVERMERDESIEMAKRLLPNVSDEDIEYLVEAFSDYPLVISYVCSLFPNQQASMRRFCAELLGDAQRLASEVRTEDQSVLLAILRRTVTLVRHRERAAFELLVLMSFIGHRVYRPVLSEYFASFFREGARVSARFAYATGLLKAFSLIQYDPTPKGYAVMHPFAQEVLRQEFSSRQEEILVRVFLATPTLESLMSTLARGNDELAFEYMVTPATALAVWVQRRHPDFFSWPKAKKEQVFLSLLQRYGKRP